MWRWDGLVIRWWDRDGFGGLLMVRIDCGLGGIEMGLVCYWSDGEGLVDYGGVG